MEEIHHNPEFKTLPEETQTYVSTRLDELQAYVAYFKKLQRGRQPADARNEQELDRIEETLRTRGDDGLKEVVEI